MRRIITNIMESVDMSLRKVTKNQGLLPSHDALLKLFLFYLSMANIGKK